ncbi:MAG: hypothetical protein IH840_03630 [Candidatus Heimdallarchaeota archaeon]|nr:hypothetical protein [Candidatus Heimdallarchaeota archaeon]
MVYSEQLYGLIAYLFEVLKSHEKFFIRERIYLGQGNHFGDGLKPVHEKYDRVMDKLMDIYALSLKENSSQIKESLESLHKTLQMFTNETITDLDRTEISKLVDISKIEVDEIESILSKTEKLDPETIESEEAKSANRVQELQEKIEDNLAQVKLSFEWKRNESVLKTTIDGREQLEAISDLLESIILRISDVGGIEFLELLASMATTIRDLAARSFESILTNVSLFNSIITLLSQSNRVIFDQISDKNITPDGLKLDIEHKMNTGRISWLAIFHDEIMAEQRTDKSLIKFVVKLDALSRDPREEFLWTMTSVARSNNNEELENVSAGYATLASSLLGLVNQLEDTGRIELANKIIEFNEITSLDAIEDIEELYKPKSIDFQHLIRAINSKLLDLKDLATQLILFDDLRDSLFQIIQFTDMDANIQDPAQLDQYLSQIGT